MSTPTRHPLNRPTPIFINKLRTLTRTLLSPTVADHTKTFPAAITHTANLRRRRHHHHHLNPTTATTILIIPVLTSIQTPTHTHTTALRS